MKSAVIQFGNSDNKLTQQEWSNFIMAMRDVTSNIYLTHFEGASFPDKPWQNYCIVLQLEEYNVDNLILSVQMVREKFQQDSVAMLIGETMFI